jgi:phosphate transport system permease protein
MSQLDRDLISDQSITLQFGSAAHKQRREYLNWLMLVLCGVAAICLLAPLFTIIGVLVYNGASSLSWEFFTAREGAAGEPGGGVGNAIIGSLMVIAIASLIAFPIGIITAIYFNEFSRNGRITRMARFSCDVLNSTPSIILGIFAYGLIVVTMGTYSALAGGIALSVLMIPVVVRGSEEVLRTIPDSLRDASLALGATRWQTVWRTILPAAKGGIVTASCLALARVGGETAPLIFTAFGNPFWNFDPLKPTNTLPLQIYKFASSPYEEWHQQAWAAALVLVLTVTLLNLIARLAARSRHKLYS